MGYIENDNEKTKTREMMEELAEKIVQEILQNKKAIPYERIDLSRFLELYEPYKDTINDSIIFGCVLEIDYKALKRRKKNKNIKE